MESGGSDRKGTDPARFTDGSQRLLYEPNMLLHISEWNDGDRLWILGCLVDTGGMCL